MARNWQNEAKRVFFELAERSQREQLEPPTYPPSPKYCAAARACTSLRPPPPRMNKIVFKLFPVLRNAPNRGRRNGALKDRPIVQTAARFRGCATIGVISYEMNEKLPAPCEACRGSGLRHGAVCGECQGKGYRLIVNGRQTPVPKQSTQRWQRPRPAQNPRHSR